MKIKAKDIKPKMIISNYNGYGQDLIVDSVVNGKRKNGKSIVTVTGFAPKHILKSRNGFSKPMTLSEKNDESRIYGFDTKVIVK